MWSSSSPWALRTATSPSLIITVRLEAAWLLEWVGLGWGGGGQSIWVLRCQGQGLSQWIRCPPWGYQVPRYCIQFPPHTLLVCVMVRATLATLPSPHGFVFSLKMPGSLNRHRIDMGCRQPGSLTKGLLPMGSLWSVQLQITLWHGTLRLLPKSQNGTFETKMPRIQRFDLATMTI